MTVTRTLGEISDESGGTIRTGPFGSQLHQEDYTDDGVPVVMPKDILDGRVSTANIARVDDEHVNRLSPHKLMPGDIVYGRRGDIGRRALITKRESGWLCGTGCLRVSLGEHNGVLNPEFLYYFLGQPNVTGWIYNQAIGATMPNLNTAIMRSIPITYPQFSIQLRISKILSAYDELIENNQRRIRILGDMAQSIYREWFVNFRFPGPERTQRVESEVGIIPDDWEVASIEDTFQICGGGTPSKRVTEYWENGDIQWYTPSDLTAARAMFMDQSASRITDLGLKKSSAQMFPPFSVMMTSRATLGVISINTTPSCTNQGFITCIPNERMPVFFLMNWLRENGDVFSSLASGATFKEITKSVFKKIKFALPPQELVSDFNELMQPLALQILNLQRKNRNLRQSRDLLLPKLISGEIDISRWESTTTEEAA